MGKIILTVEGTTVGTVANGGGVVIENEVSEQDSARLIAAFAHTYADRFKDENGDPRQPSIEEVLGEWWDGIIAGSIDHVLSVEKTIAADTAAQAVTAISVG